MGDNVQSAGHDGKSRMDWWLAGICGSRLFTGVVAMTYAAALPVLQREWGMSAASAGSIASGYQMGYAVSLVVFSALADRMGAKRLYLGSISCGAIFSICFALLARGYLSAFVLYTVVGISLGGTYTLALMLLANQYPTEKRGRATGFFIASTSCGYALSLLTSGIAIPLGGYKLSFFLTCLGPLVGSALAWITLRNTQVSVPERTKEQRFTREVLKNRPAMLLIGSYTCHSWELFGMWSWTPAFLASCLAMKGVGELSSSVGLGAYITSGFHMTGLVASFSMGSLSDTLGRARVIILLASTSTLCSFVFGWSLGWPFVFAVGIGVIYAFSAIGDSPVLSTALTEVVRPSYLGSAFGLRSLLGFGAGAVSPLVFGAILDITNLIQSGQDHYTVWGWAYSVLGLAGFGAVAAAYMLARFQKARSLELRF